MITVGVKRLKARLSEYLRAVRRGEVVVVTDRDEVVAELRAPRKKRELPEGIERTVEALAVAGELTRAAAAKRGWRWTPKDLGLSQGAAATLLDDLRRASLRR
jgi:antitoxin (DNA-binding transcriptional repressor) of toxin-antitoxin stability system